MAIVHVSMNGRNAAITALLDLLDNATTPATIKVYDGTMPATPDTAVTTQNLLVTMTCSDHAFDAAMDGERAINAVTAGTATGSGTAAWARIADGDGESPIDVDVGVSGNALILSVNSVATAVVGIGDTVDGSAGSFTFPSGA